jgi:hypothetical protein
MKPTPEMSENTLDALIAASKADQSWLDAAASFATPPTQQAQAQSKAWIAKHPDRDSYHVLGWLYKSAPEAYQAIPDTTRAQVLCDAIRHQRYLNDFAVLDPAESFTRAAGKALLALGESAIPALRKLMDDANAAPLMGSEEATLSAIYQYRRKDFAYYFLSKITGKPFIFDAQPASRDQLILGF